MAIATTLMTTPLITWLYPPEIYMKVGEPDDSRFVPELTDLKDPIGEDLNMVLAIPDIKAVSSTMSLLQCLHGPDDAEDTKKGTLTIHGARFLAMNDRMSTVLMATNESDTIQRDPALNIFKTFGNLKRIALVPHLLVTSISDFPKDLAQLAYESKASMLLVPFLESSSSPKTLRRPVEKGVMSLWATSNAEEADQSPSSGTHIMTPTASGSSNSDIAPTYQEEQIRSRMADIIDQLLRKCRVKVGVLVDRGLNDQLLEGQRGEKTEGKKVSILVPFFGGPDDAAAVLFALRLRTHPWVQIHIFHVSVTDVSDEFSRPSVPDAADQRVLDLVKSLSEGPAAPGLGSIEYTTRESSEPLSVVLEELLARRYSLLVGGHMGPRWATLMQQLAGEAANEEMNNDTVWSLLKQDVTATSLRSMIRGFGNGSNNGAASTGGELPPLPLVSTSVTANTHLERILGPIGCGVYREGPTHTSLLMIRKLRVDQHFPPATLS